MEKKKINIIYQDEYLLVVDKPPHLVVYSKRERESVMSRLIEKFPELKDAGPSPRYGLVHRLDKDTSGILLIAKKPDSLQFFQKQFQEREVLKKYLALLYGKLNRKRGRIETLIGRSPDNRLKQKAYLPLSPDAEGKRKAVTVYHTLKRFYLQEGEKKRFFTLIEAQPKTGRKHQIRVHFSHIKHPVAGDEKYSFKKQVPPSGLTRQFLHASFLRIQHPLGEIKEFDSELSSDLKKTLDNLHEVS